MSQSNLHDVYVESLFQNSPSNANNMTFEENGNVGNHLQSIHDHSTVCMRHQSIDFQELRPIVEQKIEDYDIHLYKQICPDSVYETFKEKVYVKFLIIKLEKGIFLAL